jgi:hypothetical protein
MRRLVLFAGLMLAPAAAHAFKDSVPDWVRDAAKEALPAYKGDPDAVVLLRDVHYSVQANGQAVEHYREVIRILRPQGRHYAEMGTYFDDSSKINFLHIWSIGADGHEYQLKDNEITDEGVSGGGILYADDRYRKGKAPAGDPGAIVAMEYEQKERPYKTEYVWRMQGSIPMHLQRLTLELAPGMEFRAVWKGPKATEPVNLENNQWVWELKDITAIDVRDTPLAPARSALEQRIAIHYFGPGLVQPTRGDWQSVGKWYQQLAQDRAQASPEITAKAQQLTAGKTDFYDKAEAVGDYVQKQIRYVAIEIGIGGDQPHFAQDIYKHQYGDCKDKATLLAAMLSSVGIHSTWVLVDTHRGFIDPAIPSSAGNHAIAAIEIPKGYNSPKLYSMVTAKSGKRFLIFDPTWEMTPFGQLEHELQGSYGILVDGNDSQVLALPVMVPGRSVLDRQAHFQLAADGTLSGDVVEKRYGDQAVEPRSVFTYGNEKQQREILDHVINQDLAGFSLTGVKTENVKDLDKDMVLRYSLKVNDYAKSMGPLLLVRPRVLGSDSVRLDRKSRKYPINLDEAMTATDEFDVELPAGYTVDELPDPVKIDMGFAAYESSSTVKGGTLHYARIYTVREVELPAEKYHDLQELVSAIEADERGRAVLKKTN